jgi:hypothetical protein
VCRSKLFRLFGQLRFELEARLCECLHISVGPLKSTAQVASSLSVMFMHAANNQALHLGHERIHLHVWTSLALASTLLLVAFSVSILFFSFSHLAPDQTIFRLVVDNLPLSTATSLTKLFTRSRTCTRSLTSTSLATLLSQWASSSTARASVSFEQHPRALWLEFELIFSALC